MSHPIKHMTRIVRITYAELEPLVKAGVRFCTRCLEFRDRSLHCWACGGPSFGAMVAARQGHLRIDYPAEAQPGPREITHHELGMHVERGVLFCSRCLKFGAGAECSVCGSVKLDVTAAIAEGHLRPVDKLSGVPRSEYAEYIEAPAVGVASRVTSGVRVSARERAREASRSVYGLRKAVVSSWRGS